MILNCLFKNNCVDVDKTKDNDYMDLYLDNYGELRLNKKEFNIPYYLNYCNNCFNNKSYTTRYNILCDIKKSLPYDYKKYLKPDKIKLTTLESLCLKVITKYYDKHDIKQLKLYLYPNKYKECLRCFKLLDKDKHPDCTCFDCKILIDKENKKIRLLNIGNELVGTGKYKKLTRKQLYENVPHNSYKCRNVDYINYKNERLIIEDNLFCLSCCINLSKCYKEGMLNLCKKCKKINQTQENQA